MLDLETHEPIFAALADPMRRRLLVTLAQHSPRTATQLAQDVPITRQGVIKHLDVLAAAGLVRAETRGREKQYSFAPEPLDDVAAWIERVGALWDARLARLKAIVEADDAPDQG